MRTLLFLEAYGTTNKTLYKTLDFFIKPSREGMNHFNAIIWPMHARKLAYYGRFLICIQYSPIGEDGKNKELFYSGKFNVTLKKNHSKIVVVVVKHNSRVGIQTFEKRLLNFLRNP